ncbi:MAG TPA: hypothetical protein VGJ95_23645 [Pseudonocardiaceae bacterium]|jgi:hypothetical protein
MTRAGFTPDIDEASKRVRELSDRMIELSKKNGLTWLEAYERVLESMLKLEEKAASGVGTEWVTALATTHADFVREMSQVFLGAIKEQLKS